MNNHTLQFIIKNQFKNVLADWIQYASKEDLLGLDLIQEICHSKGTKKVQAQLPPIKEPYQTFATMMKRKKKCTLQQAEENFRRRQLTTSSQFYHGSIEAKHASVNIFNVKKLNKLNLAKPLTPMAIAFIDNWLALKDDKKYEELVLNCLRSLTSKINLQNKHMTTMKHFFDGREDWDLAKPVRLDMVGQDLNVFKPNQNGIRRQAEKQRKLKEKLKELENSDFAKQLHIFKHFKIN